MFHHVVDIIGETVSFVKELFSENLGLFSDILTESGGTLAGLTFEEMSEVGRSFYSKTL